MHKCRLCLVNSKNVKCLFDIDSILGISYAEIINSFANVKVSNCDGMTDQICLSCRRKTKEFWDFKLKIERSTNALQENSLVKRVHFTNIYDIKFSKVAIEEDIKKPIPIDITEDFIKNSNGFIYKDIVIKKVSKNVKEPLSVIGFLSSIKGENENDYQDDSGYEVENDYDPDLNHDPDYNMSQQRKKKIKNKSQTDKANKKCLMILEKPIKPVFLADYSVVPSRQRPSALKKRKSKEKYICPYCGKMNTNLKSHLLTHSDMKPFKCKTCSKTFTTEKQLSVHMNQTHGRKDQKCDLCEAVFTTKYRLNSHMKNRHCPEKKYICDVCNKLWKNRYRLLRHIQLVHSFGPKPFQCELCPDRFNSSFGLKHHLRVHTGERPYNCQLCSQPYSYKHDFNRHCFKRHGVWFYRRTVHVMNEQVLAQERVLMRDLLLRLNGVLKDDKPINPFEGPQAALAFDVMVKAIQSGQLVVDLQL